MIKSITIKDKKGYLLLKVISRKNGKYEIIVDANLHDLEIDVRNERMEKVMFKGDK